MHKKWIVLVIIVYLLIVSVVLLNAFPARPIVPPSAQSLLDALYSDSNDAAPSTESADMLSLVFSHEEHFYDADIEVSISASEPAAVIHYTTDGSEPTTDSPIYTKPISFPVVDNVNNGGVHTLKAIAVHDDNVTRLYVHTYFVAKDVSERFDVLVFSLSTNEDYLYDYDTGIFVEGATRAEYKKENPGVRIEPPAPANFNWRGREGERPMYVEVFETDGTRVIAQAAGVRVHGGWSRAESQKSLRLIARKEYEPLDGRFKYDFFPDDVRDDGFGTPITKYDQIVLRNGANDRNFAMLRNEVGYAMSHDAGLHVTPAVRPAAVFLNGEYYGFAWLHVSVNEQYLEDAYSAPTKDFQVVGNGERWIYSEDEEEIAALEYLASFYDKDFTDDAVFEEFCTLVDIENLLLYYAFRTYLGDRDWPENNVKRWRYLGPSVEGLSERGITDPELVSEIQSREFIAPELDGRWRYINFDVEFSMSLYDWEINARSPSFRNYMTRGNARYSFMLSALLARPDMADRYAMYVCDIAANIMTPTKVAGHIDALFSDAKSEIGYALEAKKYDRWVDFGSVELNHALMIGYAKERSGYFLESMREHFGWDDEYFTVEVNGSDAIIGTQLGSSSTYFAHLAVPVRPALSKNEVFDYWVMGGEVIYSFEITVSAVNAVDGVVYLELVTHEESPALVISEAYGSTLQNGATLFNASDSPLTTKGLYFTYDLYDPYLWAMPLATIPAGGSLEFAGRSSNHKSDVGKVLMGINLREGRVLYLCDESGNVLDWRVVTTPPD